MVNHTNIELINKFLDYLLKERKFSLHTIRSYKIDLIQFDEFLKGYDRALDFIKIDKSAIQFYIQSCSKGDMSSKTLLRKVSSIKSFFKYLTQINFFDTYQISMFLKT